jgi:protein-S-isoprenylcysteine O-methyltransferase Ste14
MDTRFLFVYAIIVGVYGWLDILIQKNSKSIFRSKADDNTYWPILIFFIVNLTTVPVEWKLSQRPPATASFISGFVLCIIATVIRIKGQLDLKQGFSTRVELQEGHMLVNTGLYKYIRHPLYLAIILFLTGADILFLSLYSWAFTLLTIYFIHIRITKEESFLTNRLDGYEDYKKSTKKLIPNIW